MKVLLTQRSWPVAGALSDAGHVVHHCVDDSDPPRCVVDGGGRCPLDTTWIDVVAVVDADDDGARCAARRHVPAAVVGAAAPTEIAALVAATARAPLAAHSAVAAVAFRYALAAAGLPDADRADVEVRRRDGYLRVTISAPFAVPEAVAQRGAVRVCQVLRELDPDARGIDVVAPRVVTR